VTQVQAPPNAVSLADILGQDRAIETLRASVRAERVHHAWIFAGPPGVGKRTTAVAFAALLLDPSTGPTLTGEIEADPDSPIQRKIAEGTHPDLHIITKELAAHSEEARVRRQKQITIAKEVIIERLITQCPHAAVKLGPGVCLDALPLASREIEVISEDGKLVQAIMWAGNLALHCGQRTATLLPDGASITGKSTLAPSAQPGRYLYEPDASLERTQLLGMLCESLSDDIGELHPGLGLLTSDAHIESPWLRCYEIVDIMPWRQNNVRDLLHARKAGVVAVKTRGVQENPDQLQTQLRGSGDVPHVVFATRFGERRVAIITVLA